MSSSPLVLLVLDGFGERAESERNALHLAKTPELDALRASSPTTSLLPAVAGGGAPCGARGHAVLGAGRPLVLDRERIDAENAPARVGRNPMVDQTLRIAAYEGSALHVVGLVSESTAHASLAHLTTLVDLAENQGVRVKLHAILDRRDAAPRASSPLLGRLEDALEGRGQIATVSGRAYAMDCGGRWDRVYAAYHAIVRDRVLGPAAPRVATPHEALHGAYGNGHGDDMVFPVRVGDYEGMKGSLMCDFAAHGAWQWIGEEVGLAFHHRPDGLRQLSAMLLRQGLPDEIAADLLTDRGRPVFAFREHCFASLSTLVPGVEYPVAYPVEPVVDGFGEVLANVGRRQLRCAEADKAEHVTRFFGGGHARFPGEEWRIVPAADEPLRFDEDPEMRVREVARIVERAVGEDEFDFVLANLGNADLVAQTGELGATVCAVQAVDAALGVIARAVAKAGGVLLVTADHGRAEHVGDPDRSQPTTATANPVPFLCVGAGPGITLRAGGSLVDVAPTMLDLLGLERPPAMTGRSLLVRPTT